MAGPCPNGRPTQAVHEKAGCGRNCTGTGCRVRRMPRESRDSVTESEE